MLQAAAETVNVEANPLAVNNGNLAALERPFDYRDIGATAVNQRPWAVEAHTYEGPPHEESGSANGATLRGHALKKLCASTRPGGILNPPQVLNSTMYSPGKNDQTTDIRLKLRAVDPSCNGHYLRKVTILPELIRHGHVIKEVPFPLPLISSNAAATPIYPGVVSVNQPKLFWRPGDKARFVLHLMVRSVVTKKTVKETTKIRPVRVKH